MCLEMSPLDQQLERYTAIIEKRYKDLSEMICEDAHYAHSNGKVQSKIEFIESFRSGRMRWIEFSRTEETVRVESELAILTGRMDLVFEFNGHRFQAANRFLEVDRSEDKRWKLLAWQTGRIQEAGT
jgi:hypothetical protein